LLHKEFLKKYVGVQNAVQYLQERQMEAFLRNIPHISQVLNNMLNRVSDKLKGVLEAQSELKDLPIGVLVGDFFRIFAVLHNSIVTGIFHHH
jgi:L-ribulose-5-phosphate 3-epimerase UlaE